jgi:hypothetical protein
MKFSMTGQEKVYFKKNRWLLNRGDHIYRFDFMYCMSRVIPHTVDNSSWSMYSVPAKYIEYRMMYI